MRRHSLPDMFARTLLRRAIGGAARLAAALAVLAAPEPVWAQFNGDFAIEKHVLEEENFLDYKAYQHPDAWRYERYTAPNYFDGTVGSLSQKKFYFFQELRLRKDLGAYASVDYFQQEESFFKPEPIYREIELRFGKGAYASVVGFPRHDKIEGHQGLALAWGQRTDWNYLRLTHLKQYTLYNEETVTPARFIRAPVLERLEARAFWNERVLTQLVWREERPAELAVPDEAAPTLGRSETYRGRKVDAVLDVHWSETLLTGLTLRHQREQRGRAPLDATSSVSRASQQLDWDWADAYAAFTLSGGSRVETGAYHGAYTNRIDSQVATETFDHHLFTDAAYLLWTLPRGDWFHWVFSLQGGVAELATLDGAKPDEAVEDRSNQVKAGVGVVLQEAGSYRIFFNTTWDLDIFASRQWDGGNIQLLFLF